ncbi:hypothetical protein E4U24_000038 [Claviceps purpurea]|nr:hypothetical protein E4U24_000038 [Claviceps purpurea]KAG6264983.1 hypothetical protein E4U49_001273 [Claviceps purpurea]KAG6284077.1 hypothetical protein E4U48_000057 [Claviceps purpurea]
MQSVERQETRRMIGPQSPTLAHFSARHPDQTESVLARRGRRPNCMRFTSAPTTAMDLFPCAGLLLASTSISARAGSSGLRARTRQEPQAHGPMMRSTSDGQSWADTTVHGGGRPRVNAWLASMKRQFAAADRSSQAQIPFLLV